MWLELLESSEGLDQLGDRRWRAAVVVVATAGFVVAAGGKGGGVGAVGAAMLLSMMLQGAPLCCRSPRGRRARLSRRPSGLGAGQHNRSTLMCMQIWCTKSVLYVSY